MSTFSYSISVYRNFDLEKFKCKTKNLKNCISIIHNTNEFILKLFFCKELTSNEENELYFEIQQIQNVLTNL